MSITYEDIISRLEQVQEHGRYASSLCVFHSDSNPSLLVFKDGWFRCLGCSKQGRWITLWNKINGQPVQVLSEKRTSFVGPPIRDLMNLEDVCYQAHADLIQFPSLAWYLEMRGLEGRIETNELGYIKGWYTFPVRDADGGFQTAVFRAAPHVQEVTGLRYWCQSHPLPYVPDWFLYSRAKVLFVVFGIMDALTLSELRFPVVTSTSGNLTFQASWLESFRHPIYVIPDKGEDTVAIRLAGQLGWRGNVLYLEYPTGIKDANGFLEYDRRDDLYSQLARYRKE
jgi:hypothetical protein